ncbi:hypothetical protein B0H13DRAFT_1873670 [Mycena leptocephala]|nr:hypothetical protein B0H13DRAFT_1873670 [Mycena leptocephala]
MGDGTVEGTDSGQGKGGIGRRSIRYAAGRREMTVVLAPGIWQGRCTTCPVIQEPTTFGQRRYWMQRGREKPKWVGAARRIQIVGVSVGKRTSGGRGLPGGAAGSPATRYHQNMKASNARSNVQVGVKHIPDDGLMHRNVKRLHCVPINPSARLLLVIPSTCPQRLPSSVQLSVRDFRTSYRRERKLRSNQLRKLIWAIGMSTEYYSADAKILGIEHGGDKDSKEPEAQKSNGKKWPEKTKESKDPESCAKRTCQVAGDWA